MLFSRDSMQPVFSINVTLGPQRREDMGLKHYFTGTTIKSMQLTWTGCALMAVDSLSQLFLYRLSPIIDPGGPMSLNYALVMLEYCLVTGTDWWDVILSLRPGFIETICDKLTDSFNRQPFGTQSFLQNRYHSMKGSLYRCLNTGQAKAGDSHAMIMLNAVATALKGMLRPRDMSTQDKGPAETLSSLMTTAPDRMDNVLLMLEHKEFTVEPPILQSLQHLTQWVSDLALYLLTSLPSQRSFPGQQILQNSTYLCSQYIVNFCALFLWPSQKEMLVFLQCGLISDPKAINTLRELLVIIRIWGFLNEGCLPNVTRLFAPCTSILLLLVSYLHSITLRTPISTPLIIPVTGYWVISEGCTDNIDILATLFKLLTKLFTLGGEPDETLLDECNILTAQVIVPSLEFGINAQGVSSSALYLNSLPLLLEHQRQPDLVGAPRVGGQVESHPKTDVIRHVALGAKPSNYRQCTRCFSYSLFKAGVKSAATRAWDQRWARLCPCGGHWRFMPK
ncbi:MED16 [Cordylochernes scorpioides]|uniref:MED16 n=1 Tax=Cordylochernes scorpioides TaxID=51811 RepID=A0ABY6KSP3_9ARAC|nr:MED16 [Cordylochernes scorpioides]